MPDVDPELMNQILLESEQERDDLAHQAIVDAQDFLSNLKSSQQQSAQTIDALFKAADFAPSDPFSPPDNVPSYDATTYNELKQITTGQARALEIGEQIAKNHVKVEKIEGLYTDAALVQAQTVTKQQQIVNEGFRLAQVVQSGHLINAKTEGLRLQTAMQDTQNLTSAKLVELEGQKGQALIEGATIEVEEIRTANNSRLIAQQNDFQALRGAGLNGSYS